MMPTFFLLRQFNRDFYERNLISYFKKGDFIMKITIELNENEVRELKDLIFGEEKVERYSTVFDSRFVYDKFMEFMMEIAKTYDVFRVADFKDMAGDEKPTDIDYKYGWTYEQLKNRTKTYTQYAENISYKLVMPKHYLLEDLRK